MSRHLLATLPMPCRLQQISLLLDFVQLYHRTALCSMQCPAPPGHWSITLCKSTALPRCRQNTNFLPAAVILGLEPGVPINVPIVVTAEDGVTSLRYYISLVQSPGAQQCNYEVCMPFSK